MPHPRTAWIVTDGKAGDLAQAEALASALKLRTERRDIAPRRFWAMLAPLGPPDPQEDPRRKESRLSEPFPDMVIGTGRRAAPVLRAFRSLPDNRPFTVFLKDPRTRVPVADLTWAPEHDHLHGPGVVATLTAPHRFSHERLEAVRRDPPAWFAALPRPLLGVVLGGPAGPTWYTPADWERLEADLRRAVNQVGSVVATGSRRTPDHVADHVRRAIEGKPGSYWDGAGQNPLAAILALSDALLVTGDSHNMVSEALATGAPVHVFRPSRLSRKLEWFLDELARRELARPFEGLIHMKTQPPYDATAELAAAVETAYSRFRSRGGSPSG